ncbi:MAG: thioredoxin family protein [Planctomycetes bacterium]|nr:thioredoxin family protein [Planctomycetota bacterium]
MLAAARLSPSLVAALLVSLVAGAVGAGAARGADAPAAPATPAVHATLRDFALTSRLAWSAGGAAGEGAAGEEGAKAVVYFSARGGAYLVRGTALGDALLVRTGATTLASVPEDALVAREDGGVDLKADAPLKELGAYTLSATSELVVALPALKGKLAPPPPLLGWQTAAALIEHSPEYARDAKAYTPETTCVEAMCACKGEVRVFLYFGTWCQTCSMVMGRILKLEEALARGAKEGGRTVKFDYYGLPPAPKTWEDPEAVKYSLDALPTGLVYVEGSCCARIIGADWTKPEAALKAVLAGR